MKHLYFLLIIFTTTVSAKQLEVLTFNYENNILSADPIASGDNPASFDLKVFIGGTLYYPTSLFAVKEDALNGKAPYTYILNGNPSPSGNKLKAENLNSGKHTIQVTDANGCKGSATFDSSSLYTSNFVLPNFKWYPNPLKNLLTISNPTVIDVIKLISSNGNVLLTKQINDINSEIDLSNFSKGIYFSVLKVPFTITGGV